MSDLGCEPRINYSIDRARRRVSIVLLGAVTAEQVEAYMREVDSNPDYERDFDALIDLRKFTPTLSRKELERIALHVRTYAGAPASRRAVLVSDDPTLAATRLFERLTFLSPVVYRAFLSESAAEEWLAEPHPSRRKIHGDTRDR